MSSIHESLSEEASSLRKASSHLMDIAMAFKETGNTYMHHTLMEISLDIHNSSITISRNLNKHATEQYEASQRGTANMINACMAVTKLNRKDDEA